MDVNAVAVIDRPGDDENRPPLRAAPETTPPETPSSAMSVSDPVAWPEASNVEIRIDVSAANTLEKAAAGKGMERRVCRCDVGYRGRCGVPEALSVQPTVHERHARIVDQGADGPAPPASQPGRGKSGESISRTEVEAAEDRRSGRRAVGGEHLIGRLRTIGPEDGETTGAQRRNNRRDRGGRWRRSRRIPSPGHGPDSSKCWPRRSAPSAPGRDVGAVRKFDGFSFLLVAGRSGVDLLLGVARAEVGRHVVVIDLLEDAGPRRRPRRRCRCSSRRQSRRCRAPGPSDSPGRRPGRY